jgi:hypothetical protein
MNKTRDLSEMTGSFLSRTEGTPAIKKHHGSLATTSKMVRSGGFNARRPIPPAGCTSPPSLAAAFRLFTILAYVLRFTVFNLA